MFKILHTLPRRSLLRIADDIKSGRITASVNSLTLRSLGHGDLAAGIVEDLISLFGMVSESDHVAKILVMLAQREHKYVDDAIDMVWTGPETPGLVNRDTQVVVTDLFRLAKRRVMIAGFAVYEGRSIFQILAENMDSNPNLDVSLYLNISRKPGDTDTDEEVVAKFSSNFFRYHWPATRRPKIFYYPGALDASSTEQSVLHAKCIVIDGAQSFVTSANFTPAAQERNIEVGALIRSAAFSERLEHHFNALTATNIMRQISV
jgi:hypothetical protein